MPEVQVHDRSATLFHSQTKSMDEEAGGDGGSHVVSLDTDGQDIPPITYTPPPGLISGDPRPASIAKTAGPSLLRIRRPVRHDSPVVTSKTAEETSQAKLLQSFLVSLQLTLVSFFALNPHFFWKITFSLLTALFLVFTMLVKTPCLFNCFTDVSEMQANGITIDLLHLVLDYLETVHGFAAVYLLFRTGGRTKHLIREMDNMLSESKIVSADAKWTTSRMTAGLVLVLLSAGVQVAGTLLWNPRRLFRAFHPDRVKQYQVAEGAIDSYRYKYQPMFDLLDTDYLIMSVIVKFLTVVHAHLLELVYFFSVDVLYCSLVSASDSSSITRIGSRDQRSQSMSALVLQANRVLAPLISVSLLFNSVYIILETVIIFDQSGIYLFPETALCDVIKVLVAVASVILMIIKGSQIEKAIQNKTSDPYQTPEWNLFSPAMKGLIILVVSVTTFAAILISARLNDVSFEVQYQSNWTFNWINEAEVHTVAELKEQLDEGLMQIPAEYPYPPSEVRKLCWVPGVPKCATTLCCKERDRDGI